MSALLKKYESPNDCRFEEFERELHSVFAQTECAVTEEALARHDVDLPYVFIDGDGYRRACRCAQTYLTAAGPVSVMRTLYRARRGERAVAALDGDRFAFWSINRSHQSDIGGATHGAYNPLATEIWQEGVRKPPLRLYERGRLREDVYEMIVLNVRHPRDFRGDVAAMIGSARVGERRLDALIAELGSETTHAAVEAVLVGARGS